MKSKMLKAGAFILATSLALGTAYFANALVGNPVSRLYSQKKAGEYIEETYPNEGYEVGEASYSFKDGSYHVPVSHPKSLDKHFSLNYDFFGNLKYDSYDYYVGSKMNTAMRLWDEYRDLTKKVINSSTFPLQMDFGYGELKTGDTDMHEMAVDFPNRLKNEDLELDKLYDVRLLGKDMGNLIIYAESENLTAEGLAASLLKLREAFDESNIPFYAVDLELRYPRGDDGYKDEHISVDGFLYKDIVDDDGYLERVRAQIDKTEAFHEKMDNLRKEEFENAK